MSVFQYANNPQTALSGSVTAGATSISVASGAAFPARGRFTIIVDSEIMLVTGVAGTTWTVTRAYDGTSAAAHNNNAVVTGILSRASFLNAQHIDVRAFGAVGDGTTDDTAAINAAIAALPSEGGVLYFPPGTYKSIGGHTISVPTLIRGDGRASRDGTSYAATTIECTSSSASLFLIQSHASAVERLALVNTAVSAPTDGAAVYITSGDHFRIKDVSVSGFYDGVNFQDGAHWTMDGCQIIGPVRYGIYVAHVDLPDGGDQSISNTFINARTYNSTAGIFIASGGGTKITNTKINMDLDNKRFQYGILLSVAGNVITSDLLISNTSIENVTVDGIRMQTSTTKPSQWHQILLTGVQVALFSTNTTGKSIAISPDGLGEIRDVVIDGCTFRGDVGSTAPAISANNVVRLQIGAITTYEHDRALSITNSEDSSAQPLGVLAAMTKTANQGSITSPVDISGLSATVPSRKKHLTRVSFRLRWQSTIAGDICRFTIRDGSGSILQEFTDVAVQANVSQVAMDELIANPGSGGNAIYKVNGERIVGTGTVTVAASATAPATLVVEDLGPSHA